MKSSRISLVSIVMLLVGACADTEGLEVLSYDEFKAQAKYIPDTDTYVVNGDEPVENEEGMRVTYERYLASARAADLAAQGYGTVSQSLAVNTVNGVDDKWDQTTATLLTYCVTTNFGSRYATVLETMRRATGEWQRAARVRFRHVPSADANCTSSTTGVVFNVRNMSNSGLYAEAFFPSWTRANRELMIDDIAFNDPTFSLRGILRHELGHVLGFRHEHIRPEAGTGCNPENSAWRALTSYDSDSVMHYPWCNGTNTGDLVLTATDKSGANALYPFIAPTFAKEKQTYTGLNFGIPSTWEPIAGDFNGDGRQDYARVGGTGAWVFTTQAISGFTTGFQVYDGLDFGQPSIWQTITGDFNGDGRTDYARLADTGAYIFYATFSGGFTQSFQWYGPTLNFGHPSTWEPITGDFNGDGFTDYARVGSAGAWFFFGGSSGFTSGFHEYVNLSFGQPSPWNTITGDFNGDGKTDYARLGATGAWVFTVNVFGNFEQSFHEAIGLNFGLPSQWEAHAGDFNGDGMSDYARISGDGAWFFISTGIGFSQTFQAYVGLNFGTPSQWKTIVGDFNADGKSDYARLGDTHAWIFSGNGDWSIQTTFQDYGGESFGLPSQWGTVTGSFVGGAPRKGGYVRLGGPHSFMFR